MTVESRGSIGRRSDDPSVHPWPPAGADPQGNKVRLREQPRWLADECRICARVFSTKRTRGPPSAPQLDTDRLRRGLRTLMKTRALTRGQTHEGQTCCPSWRQLVRWLTVPFG